MSKVTKIQNISFAILTHNEGEYIERLLQQIIKVKLPTDEIVIVDDYSVDPLTTAILAEHEVENNIKLYKRSLKGDFAAQKNFLNSKCKKPWIVNIDADELMSDSLSSCIHDFIDINPNTDALWIPRINIVDGLTDKHLGKWGWNIDSEGHVNFPDYQLRVYKNTPQIYWQGKVHEVLNGYISYSYLPAEKEFCLIHKKDIERQSNQNDFYNKI